MFNTCTNSYHHRRHPYQEVPDPKSNILLPLLRTGLPPSSWAKASLICDPCLPSTHLQLPSPWPQRLSSCLLPCAVSGPRSGQAFTNGGKKENGGKYYLHGEALPAHTPIP